MLGELNLVEELFMLWKLKFNINFNIIWFLFNFIFFIFLF